MTNDGATLQSIAEWYRPLADTTTWRRLAYLGSTFPTGQFWFVVTITLAAVGFGTLVVWIGLPILASLPLLWRVGASVERTLAGVLADSPIAEPYQQPEGGGVIASARRRFRDPATLRDAAWLLLLFPIGIGWLVFVSVVWAWPIAMIVAPFWYGSGHVQVGWWHIDGPIEAMFATVVGLAVLPLAPRLTVAGANLHAALASGLLGPSRTAELEGAVKTLEVRTLKNVESAEMDRRRIERDLHDGAQQRLVALAMELGRAKEKFDQDPEAARGLVDAAHGNAKLALEELRDLARGIHPAVLSDRGLDPALSALAGRSPIPVQVTFRVDRRLPAVVESAAYFVVSEALANAGKHSLASIVAVDVAEVDGEVVVEVMDDGVGGAVATGRGLSGLADRVEGLGGRFEVLSPTGGPTLIRAVLPCG